MFNATNFKIQEGKAYFVDRDHKPFEHMVSYLRNDQFLTHIGDEFKDGQFYKELEYWGIPYNKK